MSRMPRAHNLTFEIVQRLGEEVVSGKYVNGLAFPTEAVLCEEYDVSRSIIREAVKMLTAKGLLSSRPRRGTEVTAEKHWNLLDQDVLHWLLKRDLSLPLLIEFTEIRLGVEPQAAYLASQNITDDQKQKLINAIENMERAEKGESDPLETDIEFHLAVIDASNNRFIKLLDGVVETALRFSIRMSNRFKGVAVASIEDHRLVADAILMGDGLAAQEGMARMLKEVLVIFKNAADLK